MKNIAVIDIDGGNIYSLKRAFSILGYECTFTSDPRIIMNAEKIFLPGVGAYKIGMKNLKEKNLLPVINDFIKTGKSLMGICLGMQLLMDYSDEFGQQEGMGLVSGSVKLITVPQNFKVPHMGWSSLEVPNNQKNWEEKILNDIHPGKECYFVHSYMVKTKIASETIAETKYGNARFCSVLRSNNIYGCQFHPEKSGKTGLKIIKNFIES